MSKVLPLHRNHVNHLIDDNEEEGVCPRYEKWIERFGTDDPLLRRRLKGRINLKQPTAVSNARHIPRRSTNKKPISIKNKTKLQQQKSIRPLRSRSIFKKIRQKGRNFGIRCKTSVDLWRKWIKRGIGWGFDPPNTQYPDTCEIRAETKDYGKKNLLNEVIPEENEYNLSSDSESNLEEEETGGNRRQQSAHDSSIVVEIKHHEKQTKQQRLSTAEKKDATDKQTTTDGDSTVKKYSKKELESVDTNKIEPVQDDDQKTDDSQTEGKPKNKLRKAFKKLLIFF